jgi:hypothetical protein
LMRSRAHFELAVVDGDREDWLRGARRDGVAGHEGHVHVEAVGLLIVDRERDSLADRVDAEIVEAFGDGAGQECGGPSDGEAVDVAGEVGEGAIGVCGARC